MLEVFSTRGVSVPTAGLYVTAVGTGSNGHLRSREAQAEHVQRLPLRAVLVQGDLHERLQFSVNAGRDFLHF